MREVAEQSKHVLHSLGVGPRLDEILTDRFAQLASAVNAVMESWSTERARRFRRIKGISDTWSSALIVQEMAFGNRVNDVVAPGMDETRASIATTSTPLAARRASVLR